MAFDHPVRLHLPQEIEHLLCPAHCKRRNHYIAALVKSSLQNPGQLPDIIRMLRTVQPVAVSGLHHHIISGFRKLRILDQRLIAVTDIPGKDQLLRRLPLGRPHLDTGRTQQMPDIRKPDPHTLADIHFPVILAGDKSSDGAVCILHRIQRFYDRSRASLCLAVLPLSLLHLDMSAVTKHDAAQIAGRHRGIDAAPESPGIQQRQKPRVIDMRMCQKHMVDQRRIHRQLTVLKDIDALLHTVVN